MEPLSITASVVAVIQISSKIMSICSDYIRDVKDAPSDLQKIMLEVAALKGIFEALRLLIPPKDDANAAGSQQSYFFLSDSVDGCARELQCLESLFPKPDDCSSGVKRRKCLPSLSSLAWPLKAHRAKKHLENLLQYKTTVSLALTAKACLDINNISDKIERIQDDLSEEKRRDILKWLVTTDPSPDHNRACQLHEPHTGKWLIRMPQYTEWKNSSIRFLWLHGIPGAGKTILASFISEDVRTFYQDPVLGNTGWAYYYCYFGHRQDETPHLLRWVINQLCCQMKAIPHEVQELYAHYSHSGSPQTKELAVALGAVLQNYHRVYLVIDALDESLERHRILDLLVGVINDPTFEKLQVLATSRRELDIERALLDISSDVSLSNPYVDKDIRVYIQNTLRANQKFSRWPKELLVEIETALVKGAKGMFRWAFCQLDILKRLNTIPDIHKALGELPRTLDETYERIMCSISLENHSIAYRTLQLLADQFSTVSLGALLEALTVDVERCTVNPDDRILDPEALLEICTCLITIKCSEDENDLTVHLAHYTVKEYLISDRIAHGSASTFQMSEESAGIFAAKCAIIYILCAFHQGTGAQYAEPDDRNRFMFIAITEWYLIVGRIHSHAGRTSITSLVLRLLDVTSPHFQNWRKYAEEFSDGEAAPPEWTVTPGDESCVTLACLCFYDLFEVAQQFVENLPEPVPFETEIKMVLQPEDGEELLTYAGRIQDGKLLHLAALMKRVAFIRYFVSKGANINAISANGLSVLGSAPSYSYYTYSKRYEELDVVKLLLEAGANPNMSGVYATPLQITTYKWRRYGWDLEGFAIARALLESGAHVNSVGDDESNISRLLVTIENYCTPKPGKRYNYYDFEEVIATRDEMWNYDSPLRIMEDEIEYPEYHSQSYFVNLQEMKELLISYGATSLHRNAISHPPAYIRARIKEHLESIGCEVSSETSNDDSE